VHIRQPSGSSVSIHIRGFPIKRVVDPGIDPICIVPPGGHLIEELPLRDYTFNYYPIIPNVYSVTVTYNPNITSENTMKVIRSAERSMFLW